MNDFTLLENGIKYWPGYLARGAQETLLEAVRAVVREAPLYQPEMPRTGKKMSVRMTNCGELGWVTDKDGGYRYQSRHPVTGRPWPSIPDSLRRIWDELAGYPAPPEACLINFYDENAKMGLHQDRDEEDFAAPVLSLSLGDDCRFRYGGTARGGATRSIRLKSGDALLLAGEARLAFHGVDRIYPETADLLSRPGRVNLTLRRVTPPRDRELSER